MSVKLAVVGEAYGQHEAIANSPFSGPTGWELNRLCQEVGLIPPVKLTRWNRDKVYADAGIRLTNVINEQPPSNKLENFCGAKWTNNGPASFPLRPGKYLLPQFSHHLERLRAEIEEWRPNLILGLGAAALWYFTGKAGIMKLRGAIAETNQGKFLPTYHPAFLFRDNWEKRPIVIFDLHKAKRQMEFPEVRRPQRRIYIAETPDDIESYFPRLASALYISTDIESKEDIMTCIGFAPNPTEALVIPFYDRSRPNGTWWDSPETEKLVLKLVRRICALEQPKIFQNGLYDMHFLWRRYAITVANPLHDTMLLHHSLYPEVQKGLGFLGSIYTDELQWKNMRGNTIVKKGDTE
jgi:uracil-DNA glycosylase